MDEFSHVVLTISLGSRHYCKSYFRDGETEAQGDGSELSRITWLEREAAGMAQEAELLRNGA